MSTLDEDIFQKVSCVILFLVDIFQLYGWHWICNDQNIVVYIMWLHNIDKYNKIGNVKCDFMGPLNYNISCELHVVQSQLSLLNSCLQKAYNIVIRDGREE